MDHYPSRRRRVRRQQEPRREGSRAYLPLVAQTRDGNDSSRVSTLQSRFTFLIPRSALDSIPPNDERRFRHRECLFINCPPPITRNYPSSPGVHSPEQATLQTL